MSVFVHPDLFRQLSGFYPSTCTIMTQTSVFSDSGQRVPGSGRVPLEGCENLACRKSPLILLRPSPGEVSNSRGQQENPQYQVNFKSYHPEITLDMTAIVDGVEYEIDGIDNDGEMTFTRLKISKPKPFGRVSG